MSVNDVTPTRRTFLAAALSALAGARLNVIGNREMRKANNVKLEPKAQEEALQKDVVTGALVGAATGALVERGAAYVMKHPQQFVSQGSVSPDTHEERLREQIRLNEEERNRRR